MSETAFHRDTTQEVRAILESAIRTGQRLRLFYGDALTGRCWNDEWHTIGKIGRSCGASKIPLLVSNARSMRGMAVLDHCIIAIQSAPGCFLYRHPLFHTGLWTTAPASAEGYAVDVLHNDSLHARFKREEQAAPYIAFMTGERWSKAAPPLAPQVDPSLPALYLRREPTTDDVVLKYAPRSHSFDIVAYHDEACTKAAARWRWDWKHKPRRNQRAFNFSFALVRLVWLPDLTKRAAKAAAKAPETTARAA